MRRIEPKRINAFTLVYDLLYNWWVILLAVIIGFCGCQIYYFAFKTQTYTSAMTISVNLSGYTTNATTTSLSRTIDIAETYKNVLDSDTLRILVEEDMGEPITGTIRVKQKPETNLIDISVTDASSEKAYKTLKSVYENYPKITENSFSNIIISVISGPYLPSSVSNPAASIAYSCLIGLMSAIICIAIILVISFFRDTVKNISDVDDLLECKLFGTVYHINKRKHRIDLKNDGLILSNPLIDYGFRNSFSEMAVKLESLQRTKHIKSVVVTSIAENEGKTTVIVNLAIALAAAGKKVVLLDSDLKLPAVYKFFRHITFKPENELLNYLKGKTDYQSILRYDKQTGVYFISGKEKTFDSAKVISGEAYQSLIKQLENEFDFVLIDTPPGGVAIDAETICDYTSGMLFVVRQDYVSVEAINDYIINIDNSKMLGCVFNDVSQLRVVRPAEEAEYLQ